jgi:hypothetical protein
MRCGSSSAGACGYRSGSVFHQLLPELDLSSLTPVARSGHRPLAGVGASDEPLVIGLDCQHRDQADQRGVGGEDPTVASSTPAGAARDERAEELTPERLGLGGADVEADDLAPGTSFFAGLTRAGLSDATVA